MQSNAESSTGLDEPVVVRLCFRKILAYGVGHFYNDLCASMWFSYMLIYLVNVLKFSSERAGIVLLAGQLTDGFCTPLVGYEVDRKTFRWMEIYGQRKSWHLIGSVLVTVAFPFLFSGIGLNDDSSLTARLLYYLPAVFLFQVGWASVQISHLALIPELAWSSHERTLLNTVRYTFTVIANLTVFIICGVLLGLDFAHSMNITSHDKSRFMLLALIMVGIGSVFSFAFHCGTKEAEESNAPRFRFSTEDSGEGDIFNRPQGLSWSDWFCQLNFYQMIILYMCARLFINISQVYLPFYILNTQHFRKEFIAIIPLVVYVTSFVASGFFSLKPLKRISSNRRLMFVIGVCVGLGGCVWMYFHNLHEKIFGVGILIGISSSILLITSLAMTADMIGENRESSAFVYGAMSFCDKLVNGMAIQLIQALLPYCTQGCPKKDWFYRDVMVFVPGGALLIAFACILAFKPRRTPGSLIPDNRVGIEEEPVLA